MIGSIGFHRLLKMSVRDGETLYDIFKCLEFVVTASIGVLYSFSNNPDAKLDKLKGIAGCRECSERIDHLEDKEVTEEKAYRGAQV